MKLIAKQSLLSRQKQKKHNAQFWDLFPNISSARCSVNKSISRPLGLICMVIGYRVVHSIPIQWNLLPEIVSHPSFHLTTPSSTVPFITLPPQGPLSSHSRLPIPPGILVKPNPARLEGPWVLSGAITIVSGPGIETFLWMSGWPKALGLRTCMNLV